jgi:hypothetical protein
VSGVAPRVDAVVLAGTHQDRRRLIRGSNKAFLPLAGALSLQYVLDALARSQRVGRTFVVGPDVELRLRCPRPQHDYSPISEKGRMLDNALEAYKTAEAAALAKAGAEPADDRAYLFLTSDIPLAVPQAIADFVDRALSLEARNGGRMDLLAGVADEIALAPFYSTPGRRGIRRPYMELKHQRLRLANIYFARPARIVNLEVLQQGFAARKLTQWRSVLRLIRTFLGNPAGVRGACHVAWFQAASVFEKAGMGRLSRLARSRLVLSEIERTASRMLGCRFASLLTPYGGLSLDIDDESDYEIISENFAAWRNHQTKLIPSLGEEPEPSPPARIGEERRPFPVHPSDSRESMH